MERIGAATALGISIESSFSFVFRDMPDSGMLIAIYVHANMKTGPELAKSETEAPTHWQTFDEVSFRPTPHPRAGLGLVL
ncbi:hypothetical protein [Cupriavidus pinatubonensis]|nr:hypothetical protein [Cupriavidus pinatubonensis]